MIKLPSAVSTYLMTQVPSLDTAYMLLSLLMEEGKNYNFDLSDTNQGGNIEKLAVHPL
jgi:hypothetical protein